MIRTQVSLDERMYEQAKQEASRQGISFAELCRRALAIVLQRDSEEKPWMRYAGVLDLDDPHASRTVDEVLCGRERQ